MFPIKESDPTIVYSLQCILHYINPYINGFNLCRQRLNETEDINPTMYMIIKIAYPTKQNRDIYNYLTSTEITSILISENDSYKDIIK